MLLLTQRDKDKSWSSSDRASKPTACEADEETTSPRRTLRQLRTALLGSLLTLQSLFLLHAPFCVLLIHYRTQNWTCVPRACEPEEGGTPLRHAIRGIRASGAPGYLVSVFALQPVSHRALSVLGPHNRGRI